MLKPASFRRDRPPPPSPFAEEEPQSSDGTANNSASQGHDYSSMRSKQVGPQCLLFDHRVFQHLLVLLGKISMTPELGLPHGFPLSSLRLC